MELIIPEHYDPRLDIRETQDAIKYIRDTFQKEMGTRDASGAYFRTFICRKRQRSE